MKLTTTTRRNVRSRAYATIALAAGALLAGAIVGPAAQAAMEIQAGSAA